ncbi:hypothetical protein C8250_033950 [Streptomyces sp. So13.3]|uniref:hypothetical protein n=1 Tax=Streptomyces sp. H39-C1 TaxID=3004355 RepID=UPI00164D8B83|nr:hypothetical protein [Streptomyces sp. H39-C1]QNA76218.1 hypothetical protein C8250_033950 [Streptomyces sp. So13.3]
MSSDLHEYRRQFSQHASFLLVADDNDAARCKDRNVMERAINKLKVFRAVATR